MESVKTQAFCGNKTKDLQGASLQRLVIRCAPNSFKWSDSPINRCIQGEVGGPLARLLEECLKEILSNPELLKIVLSELPPRQ
jgi:hypothetical protein